MGPRNRSKVLSVVVLKNTVKRSHTTQQDSHAKFVGRGERRGRERAETNSWGQEFWVGREKQRKEQTEKERKRKR